MSNNSGLSGNLWDAFINYVFRSGDLSIPSDYHGRCEKIAEMLDNDVTGIVSTITNYSINSATEAKLKIECNDETLETILNIWLSRININVNGIPTGLRELSKEYYKERWQGSSLCLMRISNWEDITVKNVTIKVPIVLWFVNGSSVYIKRKNKTNYKLGTDKYYLDENSNNELPKTGEQILISKPFSRWFDEYPSPYLVKTGVLKNFLGLEALFAKGDEVISKVLPYLLIMTKGTEREMFEGHMTFDDPDLQKMADNFKKVLERYKNEKSNVPMAGFPFDQKLEHLIPDLRNILSAELSQQGYRALLSGLGFVAVLQGIGDSRKEEVLNPKPFITEVNAGLNDFKSMLMDVVQLIIKENKIDHRKLFSDNKSLEITNTPLKINVEPMLDAIRSGFVYGAVSYSTYQETLGLSPTQEEERAKKDWDNGLRELFYPHLIQNQEATPDNEKVTPITKKETEKNKEKETKPENMQEAVEENLEMSPYKNDEELLKHQPHLKKIPRPAREVFMKTFNDVYEKTGDESKAFPIAYTQMNKYLKRHYIKNPDQTYTRKGDQ